LILGFHTYAKSSIMLATHDHMSEKGLKLFPLFRANRFHYNITTQKILEYKNLKNNILGQHRFPPYNTLPLTVPKTCASY